MTPKIMQWQPKRSHDPLAAQQLHLHAPPSEKEEDDDETMSNKDDLGLSPRNTRDKDSECEDQPQRHCNSSPGDEHSDGNINSSSSSRIIDEDEDLPLAERQRRGVIAVGAIMFCIGFCSSLLCLIGLAFGGVVVAAIGVGGAVWAIADAEREKDVKIKAMAEAAGDLVPSVGDRIVRSMSELLKTKPEQSQALRQPNEIAKKSNPSREAIKQLGQLNQSTYVATGEIPYDELKWKDAPLYSIEAPDSSQVISNSNDTSARAGFEDMIPSSPSSACPNIPIRAERTALLVVDVQPEYWSNCPSIREDFPDFPDALKSTIATCRERHAKIIFIRADYNFSHSPWLVQFERIQKGRISPEVPCNPTSTTFKWEDFATPQGGEAIIAKTSWSSTSHTVLMDVLRCSGIDTVLVCGLITSVCVQHSAFGIFEAGYRTLLVTDACADRGRARHDAALALYGDYMYELVTSHSLQNEMVPAEPAWLTMDSSRNMVRALCYSRRRDKEEQSEMARAIILSPDDPRFEQLPGNKKKEHHHLDSLSLSPVAVANHVSLV